MTFSTLARALIGLVVLGSSLSCGQAPAVELWVTTELRDGSELAAFDFLVLDAQVQPAGFEVFADHRVSDEWQQLEVGTDTIDLLRAQSEPILVARGQVTPGDYDRVFLRPSALQADDGSETVLTVKNVMEPTAVSFSYDDARTTQIVLEIIVIATSGDEDYSVFAKDTTAQ